MCAEAQAGRVFQEKLCVLERKPIIFLSPACLMHLLHICFALFLAGSHVPLCSGFQGWLGQYYVQWTRCCGC